MEKVKKTRINVNVPEDLYIAYKKVLLDQRTNTTYDIIRYMKEVVAMKRFRVTNLYGEGPDFVDLQTGKELKFESWGTPEEMLVDLLSKYPEYKEYVTKHHDEIIAAINKVYRDIAGWTSDIEFERKKADMFQGGGYGDDDADNAAWKYIRNHEK